MRIKTPGPGQESDVVCCARHTVIISALSIFNAPLKTQLPDRSGRKDYQPAGAIVLHTTSGPVPETMFFGREAEVNLFGSMPWRTKATRKPLLS